MNIGTAKPSHDELSLVPHHLVDIINPDEKFSLVEYQELAHQVIGDIQMRERLPFLVGGSGQYIWAVLEGWKTPPVPPDTEFRHNLEEMATNGGADMLYRELTRVDPAAARKIDPRNIRRVIRAIEVHRQTGTPFSQLGQKEPPARDTFIVGLTMDRAELYRRLDERVNSMMEWGLVAEVENLLKQGYRPDMPAMSGIGYRQIIMYLKGDMALASAIQQTKFETHRFVRQQYTWFQLKDERIHWFDVKNQSDSDIESAVTLFIQPSS